MQVNNSYKLSDNPNFSKIDKKIIKIGECLVEKFP